MATANESSLPERLAEHDEEEWARFRDHLDYSAGFWLAFIFAPSSLDANVFRFRVTNALAADGGGRMDVFLPQSPDELREALPWMLSKERAGAGCVWVQALQVDGAGRDEQPWAAAWEHVFLRTNGFRDVLRDRLKGGLVFVAPTHAKVMVRDAAPDLWSVRTIVLELSGQATANPEPLEMAADEKRLMAEHRTTTTAPDPVYWLEEANRREPGSEGRAFALNQAALGWVGERRFADAIAAMAEAVEIYRKLTEQNPETFLPALAMSLYNLGKMQSELGQRELALVSTQDSVDVYRKLAEQHPETFLPHFARSLDNLGIQQSELGQHKAALVSTKEAVGIRRKLAQQHPEAFLRDLASSLNNLGVREAELEEYEAAHASTHEAVDIYRKLTKQQAETSLPHLARSLSNLGGIQTALGQREAALASAQEDFEIYRKLADQDPETFLPDLAHSLNNLGIGRLNLGQREPALTSTQEAVDIYRKLAEQRPETFLSDLAMALNNLSTHYHQFERHAEALALAQEAFDIRWGFYQQYPQAFAKRIQLSIAQLRALHESLGTEPDERTRQQIEAFEAATRS